MAPGTKYKASITLRSEQSRSLSYTLCFQDHWLWSSSGWAPPPGVRTRSQGEPRTGGAFQIRLGDLGLWNDPKPSTRALVNSSSDSSSQRWALRVAKDLWREHAEEVWPGLFAPMPARPSVVRNRTRGVGRNSMRCGPGSLI